MESSRESPALTLARRIAARLKREKLLSDRADRFTDALANGKLKEGDWRLALEAVSEPMDKQKKR
jgi:hypothetical protein